MGLLILLSLIVEVGVLLYLELKAWDTLFTPLNILMLPYLAVLLISVGLSGHFGFVDMYYPSVIIWLVALPVFAIPSQYLAYVLHKNGKPYQTVVENDEIPRFMIWVSLLVCLSLFYRLRQTLASCPFQLGTNEFGEAFDHNGFWSHISRLNTIMLMVMVFYVDKKHRYIWLIILLQLVLLFIHKVKGWIFVPVIAGMIMRLCSGKNRLSFRFILFMVLGAIGVFFIIYIVSLVLGQNVEFGGQLVGFIFRHVIHYLTSGVLGLSEDMVHGIPDRGSYEIVIAQFVNIARIVTGNPEQVSTLNPYFFFTGFNLTNVRTLFGTIYINSNPLSFIMTVFGLSVIIHAVKLVSVKYNNIYTNLVLFYMCSLLFMGWFDTFFNQLAVLEVPAQISVLWFVDKALNTGRFVNRAVES